MTAPYIGHQQTFSVNGTSMFGSLGLAKRASFAERDGIRGTRSHDIDDVAPAGNTVNGQLRINPSNTELAAIDVLAIGAGGTVDETCTEFACVVDKGADVYTYANCKMDRLTIRGRQGELIEVTADIEALTESATGSSPSEPTAALPFHFQHAVLTVNNTAYEVMGFELVVDNALIKDHFQNNQDRSDLPEGDRVVTLMTEHAYSTNTSGLHSISTSGVGNSTLVVGDGTATRTYTFGKLIAPDDGPDVIDRGPIGLTKRFVAKKDGATKEIAVA